MALRLELKPGERIILGDCVITNSAQRTRLLIEGEMPLLREKDILAEEAANTPARRIYFSVQCQYLFPDKSAFYLPNIQRFLKEFAEAAPSTLPLVQKIEHEVAANQLYQALKTTKQLIAKEQEILNGFTAKELRENAHSR